MQITYTIWYLFVVEISKQFCFAPSILIATALLLELRTFTPNHLVKAHAHINKYILFGPTAANEVMDEGDTIESDKMDTWKLCNNELR